MRGVVTRSLSPLPGTVRKAGFQRNLLPRARLIAGTQAAVQTLLQWNLPRNQGLYPDANEAVSAHLERSSGVGTTAGSQESAPGCGLTGPTHAERNLRAKDVGDFTPPQLACSYLKI